MTFSNNETTRNVTAPLYESDVFFDFIIPGVLLNAIGLLGLMGNVISIIILSRPQMRSSINCILIGLASYDSVLILTGILMFGVPSLYTYTHYLFHYYYWNIFPYITPIVYPIGLIAQTGSAYLTLCVTIERYVAVCLPLRARSLCTYGRARFYVISIGSFAVLYNLPRFWEVTWDTTYYREFGQNYTEVVATSLRSDPVYISIYITWMYLVVMYFFPFVCLAAFNLRIYFQVRKANSERARLSRLQKKEIGLATMLMVVVFVFFVCNALALVVNILEVMKININALTQTSNLLITFNSSVNFIIYCIFGEKFKRIFYRLFCPILKEAGRPEVVHRYPPDFHTQRYISQNNNLYQVTNFNNEVGEGLSGSSGVDSNPGYRRVRRLEPKIESSASSSSSCHNENREVDTSCSCTVNRELLPLRNSAASVIIEERKFLSDISSLVRSHSDSGDWKKCKKKIVKYKDKKDENSRLGEEDKDFSSLAESLSETKGSNWKSASSTPSLSERVHRLVVPGVTQDITITVNIRTFPEIPSTPSRTHRNGETPPSLTPPSKPSVFKYSSAHSEAAKEAVKLLSTDSSRLDMNGCRCEASKKSEEDPATFLKSLTDEEKRVKMIREIRN